MTYLLLHMEALLLYKQFKSDMLVFYWMTEEQVAFRSGRGCQSNFCSSKWEKSIVFGFYEFAIGV